MTSGGDSPSGDNGLSGDIGRAFGDDPLQERVIASDVIHRGRTIEIRVETIERADGSLATRDIVGHPGAVAVLAIDDAGRLLLVRQWRVPTGRALLEVPAGTLDVHDGQTEDPDGAARRELEEETGHRAATWQRLATFWTAPGFATELMHLYLATGLDTVGDDDGRLAPDEDERLEVRRIPLDEALAMAERGELADAKSLLGVLLLDRLRREGRLPDLPAPSTDAVHLRYGFSPREFALANAAFTRRQRSSLVLGWTLVALTALNLATFRDPFLATVTAVLGAGLLTGLFVVPFLWWSFRRKAALMGEVETTIDAAGVTSGAALGGGTVHWSGIEKIEQGGRWYFIRSATGMAVPIPEQALSPDQLRTFQRLALEHGLTLDGHRVDTASR